jgi:membrane-associated HD superfamily phosphohydrolase
MPRAICLSVHEAQTEMRKLSELILTSEDDNIMRNRYTARRSRLIHYLKNIDSKSVVMQHERTIAFLRTQVNNLIGMLKEKGLQVDYDNVSRPEQLDETHTSWYDELCMADSCATPQSRSATTMSARKNAKQSGVPPLSKLIRKSRTKTLSKSKDKTDAVENNETADKSKTDNDKNNEMVSMPDEHISNTDNGKNTEVVSMSDEGTSKTGKCKNKEMASMPDEITSAVNEAKNNEMASIPDEIISAVNEANNNEMASIPDEITSAVNEAKNNDNAESEFADLFAGASMVEGFAMRELDSEEECGDILFDTF